MIYKFNSSSELVGLSEKYVFFLLKEDIISENLYNEYMDKSKGDFKPCDCPSCRRIRENGKTRIGTIAES